MTAPPAAGPRTPLVTGIEPGVGASTLAAALHAEDGGVLAQHADIVVCRATPESLRAAAAVACPGQGPRPLLVVTGGPIAAALPGAIPTRFGSVVELPEVQGWTGRATPADEAAAALTDPAGPLQPYAEALRNVVAALLGSGLLGTATPPMVIRPRPAEPWRGLRPPPQPLGRHPAAPVATAEAARPRHRLPESAPCPPPPPRSTPRPAAEPATTRVDRNRGADPGRPGQISSSRTGGRPVADEDDESIESRNLLAGGRAG